LQYISDATITTDVDWEYSTGLIKYDLDFVTSPDAQFRANVTVEDEDGVQVAKASGKTGEMRIPNIKLWQPGNAYLYQVTATLRRATNDSLIDTYAITCGVRTVEVKGSQFLINNAPFYFTGFGKHEDTPIRGKGHDPAYMVHDFELIKWLGANSFRTSHYPYAEEVLDYADRQGIVVTDETAAVGLNLGIASGLFGMKAPKSFGPDAFYDATREAHEQGVRELIARDKNHACVVMWSIANEPASHEDGAREYFTPIVELTRKLDNRPVCFANLGLATSEKDQFTDMFDVLCLNRYYGWYESCGDLVLAERELEKDLRGW
jgi:beta-glucuronidase